MGNKRNIILLLITMLALSLACGQTGTNNSDIYIEMIATKDSKTAVQEEASGETDQGEAYQSPAAAEGTGSTGASGEYHDYSVTAQNNTCVCQVDGNVTTAFNITEDQLEIAGTDEVFDKIGDNTYKRTWMGYYLTRNEGEEEYTQVDREESSIIILTDTGYIRENYQGDDPSPCCVFTFTRID